MNTLSIVILLIGLFSKLSVVFIVLMAAFFILASVFFIVRVSITEYSWDSEQEIKDKRSLVLAAPKWAKRLIIGSIVCAFLAAIMPSERTMWLIVGSEIGEKIYNSEDFNSVKDPTLELIRKKIQTQIEEYNEELSKKDKK